MEHFVLYKLTANSLFAFTFDYYEETVKLRACRFV